MPKRKMPEGAELRIWLGGWETLDHQGKIDLCTSYDISYDTGKHWYSDAPPELKNALPIGSAPVSLIPPSVPTKLDTGSDTVTFAILGDTHNPYQDNDTMSIVEEFLAEHQPDYLVYNGDVNDFYQVSVFAKDPGRLGSLQSDIDVTNNMFARHDSIMPGTKKILLEGTHESRWTKYLQQRAPALYPLRGNNIENLYALEKYDIDFVPFERGLLINGVFLILHGEVISKHSSYTAKMQYDRNGGSGMCNHTHRGGSYYKRDRFGTWGWWENFCLCSLNPDWIQNPDWMQGFSLVHFHKKRFWVEQIPIIDHAFIYGGKVYRS